MVPLVHLRFSRSFSSSMGGAGVSLGGDGSSVGSAAAPAGFAAAGRGGFAGCFNLTVLELAGIAGTSDLGDVDVGGAVRPDDGPGTRIPAGTPGAAGGSTPWTVGAAGAGGAGGDTRAASGGMPGDVVPCTWIGPGGGKIGCCAGADTGSETERPVVNMAPTTIEAAAALASQTRRRERRLRETVPVRPLTAPEAALSVVSAPSAARPGAIVTRAITAGCSVPTAGTLPDVLQRSSIATTSLAVAGRIAGSLLSSDSISWASGSGTEGAWQRIGSGWKYM
jgi:hypothetical protein